MDKADNTLERIAIAGLLHDIGIFMQFAKENDEKLKIIQEVTEKLKKIFSNDEVNEIRNILLNHHNQKSDNYIEILIGEAASLSSGGINSNSENDVDSMQLNSVFQFVDLGNNPQNANPGQFWLHNLQKLNPTDRSSAIFPVQETSGKLVDEYKNLFEGFLKDFKILPDTNVNLFINALLSLLETYTWCIPSKKNSKNNDISLFDHLKTTAAIAVCLYQYHHTKNTLNESAIKNKETEEKYAFLIGDLSGIQDYIFNITNIGVGGAAKRLRARSFYINILTEVASHKVLHKFGLPLPNLLMSSGGKFYILLPNIKSDDINSTKNKIEKLKDEFDGWCVEHLGAEISLNLAYSSFLGDNFNHFNDVLTETKTNLIKAKQKPFNNFLTNADVWNEGGFVLTSEMFQYEDEEKLCKSCKKRAGKKDKDDSKEKGFDIYYCKDCRDDKEIGKILPKVKYIAFFDNNNKPKKSFEIFEYFFQLSETEVTGDDYYLQYKLFSAKSDESDESDVFQYQKFIANYIPRKENDDICSIICKEKDICDASSKLKKDNPIFFECISRASDGREVLGYLKADVDNLGKIFSFGLQKENTENSSNVSSVSISRITTMSRMLELFFAGRIQALLEATPDYKYIYTVYSGGDDLLLIGPWDKIIKFASDLRDEFNDYVCKNADITFSAGIILAKPHSPVLTSVNFAEESLELSKIRKRREEKWKKDKYGNEIEPKNHLTIFGETIGWENLKILLKRADQVARWQENKQLSTGFIRNLLYYFDLFKSYYLPYDESIKFRKTLGLKFLPLLSYDIARNLPSANSKNKTDIEIRNWADSLRKNSSLNFSKNTDLLFLSFIANYSLNKNRN